MNILKAFIPNKRLFIIFILVFGLSQAFSYVLMHCASNGGSDDIIGLGLPIKFLIIGCGLQPQGLNNCGIGFQILPLLCDLLISYMIAAILNSIKTRKS